jgi:hypothetical protein
MSADAGAVDTPNSTPRAPGYSATVQPPQATVKHCDIALAGKLLNLRVRLNV